MSEYLIIPSITVAFAVTVVCMFALRPVAKSVRLLDRPGGRKSHIGEVPIIGGIAMFAGVFAGLTIIGDARLDLLSLFVASMILVGIGVVDDKYHISPFARVVAQIAVILIMVFGAGLALQEIGNPLGIGEIRLGVFSLIATAVVSLTVINAYNLIDGVDGLAGLLALVALISIAAVGGPGQTSTVIALMIVAVICGFLVFNFPVAWNRSVRSFMGDAGSTFLGFTIVWTTLGVSQGAERIISPVYCLWFASIPIYDLLTCFVMRSFAGKSPFTPGRDHFHHTLIRGGIGLRQVLGILVSLQVAYAVVALAAYYIGVPEPVMFAGWIALAVSQRLLIRTIARYHRWWKLQRKIRAARGSV